MSSYGGGGNHPYGYNPNATNRQRQSDDDSSYFAFHDNNRSTTRLAADSNYGRSNTRLAEDTNYDPAHRTTSGNSTNFLQPERTYNRLDHSIIDDYYGRPIFDTNQQQDPRYQSHPQDNPFDQSYEMQYANAGPNYNQSFVPNVYDDNEEREFDERIQYDKFKGDHYDLAAVSYDDEATIPLSGTVQEEQKELDEEQGPFEEGVAPYVPPPAAVEVREKKPIRASGINGHLVLDCPVASELLSKFPDYRYGQKDGGLSREFAFMRYTAVTCGPSNFYRDAYILRPVHYPVPRQTELMIVITMYNEDDILLGRTLKGVFKNIKHLESKSKSSVWGKDSWKKIVVCIVSDGRTKINERAQALLAGLGVYQEGLAKSMVDDKKVQAHMYEYTTRVGISDVRDGVVKLTTNKIVPVQMLFCLKEANAKKINSHRWCFQAIGQVLDPKIVILLDAGTQPSGKSLYKLWKEFDRDHQVAGACGEITAGLKKTQMITNPLVYGQNFEYKISNILDKPTESVFGFISVLPGAFSAYRFVALQNDVNGKGPLEKYFKGEFLHGSGELDPNDDEYEMKRSMLKEEAGIFTSNMYLAEDRILCFELVAKRGCNWLLRYCKSASAETDVPEGMAEFILQRRRWLNGSFFAAIYALAKFPYVWRSSHSFLRKIFLHIEFMYQLVSLIVSWFSIGSYFLVFRILTTSLADPALNFAPGNILSVVFLWLYLASIVTTFVLSFGNKPKGTEKFYIVIVIFFAILMGYMIFAALFMAIHAIKELYRTQTQLTLTLFLQNAEFRNLVVATASTYALYFLASFLYFEPWHMFTSFAQYILLSPSYVNVLNIYAFCNIDDVSWGTKGDTGGPSLGEAKLREDGTFDVSVPVRKEEINQSYLNQLEKIRDAAPPPEKHIEKSNEDYYAFIRSMTVLLWMVSNFVIIAVVLETGGFNQFESVETLAAVKSARAKVFLTVILWTVVFMAAFRFIGCVTYLIFRLGSRMKRSEHATKI